MEWLLTILLLLFVLLPILTLVGPRTGSIPDGSGRNSVAVRKNPLGTSVRPNKLTLR